MQLNNPVKVSGFALPTNSLRSAVSQLLKHYILGIEGGHFETVLCP